MPWPSDLAAERLDLRARRWWRRWHRHSPAVVLDSYRTEALVPHVVFVELARCAACSAAITRVRRFGPGSSGDTGWVLAP